MGLGNGEGLSSEVGSTAIATALAVGRIAGITQILDMDASDIEETLYAR